MFSRRLIKILTVMERFRMEAELKGHLPFADALQSCTLEIAGGNMDCPLGKLVVDESVRTGVFMAFNTSAPAPSRRDPVRAEGGQAPPVISPMTVLEWQSKHTKLWSLLKEDARFAKDTDCLEALEACNDLTQNHRCPVRELIVQGLWHGDKS
ncbi:MAG: hypothetical protein A3H49_11355 [Nitrospirae bacterium RIFCSPLOWO2_02_FULL_62_14]|nr:MAG: hypothetical protein A3A88_01810 [Nitrospirae bacterium RIFCSPLOWO2_01_FULL_62_17]OGW68157.1 MAG: hypothetical protein A3H49_11355 [Nitrospirae bacterium RIFCSPLOWO2_02_FULL_62_14]